MNPEFSNEKIAVLAGGPSCEKEISLRSGRNVMEALRSRGFSPLWVEVDSADGLLGTLRREKVTLAFIALHGTFGEDGTVQRLLEKEGILYTGPGPLASERAFDKAQSQTLFKNAGIRVPEFEVYGDISRVPDKPSLPFPLVVKPARAGSSVGVTIVSRAPDLRKAAEEAFRYSDAILAERFIPGRELTVGVLGEQALPVVEVVVQREFYDYEAKYGDTGTRYEVPARLSEKEARTVVEESLKAHRTLGCEMMSRVDLMLAPDGKVYVLEVNTIPGLTSKSLLPKAAREAGIDFPELCVRILAMALARKRMAPTHG